MFVYVGKNREQEKAERARAIDAKVSEFRTDLEVAALEAENAEITGIVNRDAKKHDKKTGVRKSV